MEFHTMIRNLFTAITVNAIRIMKNERAASNVVCKPYLYWVAYVGEYHIILAEEDKGIDQWVLTGAYKNSRDGITNIESSKFTDEQRLHDLENLNRLLIIREKESDISVDISDKIRPLFRRYSNDGGAVNTIMLNNGYVLLGTKYSDELGAIILNDQTVVHRSTFMFSIDSRGNENSHHMYFANKNEAENIEEHLTNIILGL